ncbi:MAG: hypothetical protein R3C18_27365 [Planctomycetaceae bacterium]
MKHLPILGVVMASLLGVALVLSSAVDSAEGKPLEAGPSLHWYKGNMHTHSHWSDGDDYLEMIATWYDDHDYDFLVFTDHNVLANKERWVDVEKTKGGKPAYEKLKAKFPDWIEERTQDDVLQVRLRTFAEVSEKLARADEFLLIQGEEISDQFHRHPIHMNAHNVPELLTPRGGESVREVIQNNVDAVRALRERTGEPMFVHLNHPNFGYAVTAEDLFPIVGEKFFEVYNGHPGVHNSGDGQHASTERIWDIVLTKRLAELDLPVMYGLAVDDGHSYHKIPSRASEPGRGWVMVLANELTPAALVEAMENGKFYASSGVTLKRVESSSRELSVEVDVVGDETYTIEFIGTRKGYNPEGKPVVGKDGEELLATLVYDGTIGEVLETVEGPKATYTFRGDEIYVRARITSSQSHPNPSELGDPQRAWIQPVVGPGKPQ